MEPTLSQRQSEKARWTKLLTARLPGLADAPEETRVLTGGGVLVLLRRGPERLVVELVHTNSGRPGYRTIGPCTLRYQGRALGPVQETWIDAIAQTVEAIPRAAVPEWAAFLDWATRLPSRGFGVESDERTAQGQELLIRLLEPCQARCEFCICRSAQPDMVSTPEDIEDRLVSGQAAGYTAVVFTGGEPTLVKELPELIARARALGYRRVGIQTNGLKLARPEYAQKLVKAGLNYALQSLHSHDAATHESIFQIDGCFEDCVASAQNLLGLGVALTINYVTTTANQRGHRDFIAFVQQRLRRPQRWRHPLRSRYPRVTFSSMSPQGWGAGNQALLPRLSVVAGSVRDAVVLARQAGIRVRIPGLCGFPPCLLPEMASIFYELQEPDPLQLESRQFFEGCASCAFRPRCSGYWKGYAAHHGTDEFQPALAADGHRIPRRWPWTRT